MFYNNKQDSQYDRRIKDWEDIEEMVSIYQKQFQDNNSKTKKASIIASEKLVEKFNPLIKKYLNLLKTGDINWNDMESRYFICMFMDNKELQSQCRRKFQTNQVKQLAREKFNFVKEMCSKLEDVELKADLQILLLTLAKRYKQVGRNFCSYVYNCYQFEVYRWLKKLMNDPMSFEYKICMWTEEKQNEIDLREGLAQSYDSYAVDLKERDTPGERWIDGTDCSDAFKGLNILDRKILIKYYLEEWKDQQIAEHFCMHINTVNQRRRNAAKIIAEFSNIDISEIKRTRKSGKRAILPI